MRFFSVNFILQKFCSCKKNDKYEVGPIPPISPAYLFLKMIDLSEAKCRFVWKSVLMSLCLAEQSSRDFQIFTFMQLSKWFRQSISATDYFLESPKSLGWDGRGPKFRAMFLTMFFGRLPHWFILLQQIFCDSQHICGYNLTSQTVKYIFCKCSNFTICREIAAASGEWVNEFIPNNGEAWVISINLW